MWFGAIWCSRYRLGVECVMSTDGDNFTLVRNYVDDLNTVVLDFPQPRECARHAVPLALDVMYREKHPDNPIEH